MSEFRTPLRQARGLGSAKDGIHHWLSQRATAIALIPLTLWFVGSVVAMTGADYEAMRGFLANPINAIPMLLFVLAAFYHMKLGLQVVVEDYIGKDGTRIMLLLLINFAIYAVGAAAIFSVLKISFSG